MRSRRRAPGTVLARSRVNSRRVQCIRLSAGGDVWHSVLITNGILRRLAVRPQSATQTIWESLRTPCQKNHNTGNKGRNIMARETGRNAEGREQLQLQPSRISGQLGFGCDGSDRWEHYAAIR